MNAQPKTLLTQARNQNMSKRGRS